MPLVRSIDELADGWNIVTTRGGTFTVSSALLTAAQKAMTPAQIETVANAWLTAHLPAGMFAAVHLTSVVPLQGALSVSNDPLTGDWWD